MNTGQIDHRFTGVNLVLEVSAQAPIPAQPTEGSFDDPPARDDHEAFGVHRTAGNLQPPPTGVLDPPPDSFIASIGPDEFPAAPPVVDTALDSRKEFLQERFATRAIRHARTMHHHQHEQPQDIYYDVAFPPIDLLVDIHAPGLSAFGRLDAVAVDNDGTGLGLSPCLLSYGFDQHRVKGVPQSTVTPPPVVAIHLLPWRKVVWHQSPCLPTAYDIEDGIENLAVRPGTWAASGTPGHGEQGGKAAPLFIIQIRWVRSSGLCFHPPKLSNPFPKHSLRPCPYGHSRS